MGGVPKIWGGGVTEIGGGSLKLGGGGTPNIWVYEGVPRYGGGGVPKMLEFWGGSGGPQILGSIGGSSLPPPPPQRSDTRKTRPPPEAPPPLSSDATVLGGEGGLSFLPPPHFRPCNHGNQIFALLPWRRPNFPKQLEITQTVALGGGGVRMRSPPPPPQTPPTTMRSPPLGHAPFWPRPLLAFGRRPSGSEPAAGVGGSRALPERAEPEPKRIEKNRKEPKRDRNSRCRGGGRSSEPNSVRKEAKFKVRSGNRTRSDPNGTEPFRKEPNRAT